MDKATALTKAAALCGASEQCSSDMHTRLIKWGVSDEDASEIMARLIDNHFIDDLRYARAFTHDKLRYNRWGRVKIAYALRQKQLASATITEALRAIDDEWAEEYREALLHTVAPHGPEALRNDIAGNPKQRDKTLRHAASHGFTADEIYEILRLR